MDGMIARDAWDRRMGRSLDRIERLYLKGLRAALLVVATLLLVTAVMWAGYNLYRVLRSPDSVVTAVSTVAASELVAAPSEETKAPAAARADQRQERAFYDDFVRRYHALYRTAYAPSLRPDDRKLSPGEFDDLSIDSGARLRAIAAGDLDFATDRADLQAFLPVMTQVSQDQATRRELTRYRTAKKQTTVRKVQRTRTESRPGWDTYSMSCSGWYLSPTGCAVTRRVSVPYVETVRVTGYPDTIRSPNQILKAYQDRYFALLAQRRRDHADTAAIERRSIMDGNVAGWAGLSQAVLIVGAFLVLMFFFLLVAIERHLRSARVISVEE